MPGVDDYLKQISNWGYAYCTGCDRIRYSPELEATNRGIRCRVCGSDELEEPAWVRCPHEKASAVKCPRGGKGIVHRGYVTECRYRCGYRKV